MILYMNERVFNGTKGPRISDYVIDIETLYIVENTMRKMEPLSRVKRGYL